MTRWIALALAFVLACGLAVACTVDVDIGPNPGPVPDASPFPDGALTSDAENPGDATLVDGGVVDATFL